MSTDRVALITGASSGIGYALAKVLAREDGYAVGLLARRADRLEELREAIVSGGGRALAVPADVGDRAAVATAVREVEAGLGPVDLLVANAGLARGTSALAPDGADFRTEVEVNLLGVLHAIEAVVPGMVVRKCGHVVAISSLASRRGFPGSAGYCATKAALNVLMEGLRVDWTPLGIHTTTVLPGFVDTEILAGDLQGRPFLWSAEKAASRIARAIRKRRRTYAFPWPLTWLTRLAPLLPDFAFRRYGRDRRDPPRDPRPT